MCGPFWRRLHCIGQPAMLQALRALADRPQGLQPGADRHILHCRARLMAMNELEREMELAERAERRDDLMQRRQLLQKQRQAERRQKESSRKVRPQVVVAFVSKASPALWVFKHAVCCM
jgi:hypothetical protein